MKTWNKWIAYIADGNGDWRRSFANSVTVSSKAEHSNSEPQYVPDKNAYTCSPKDVYKKVHGRSLGEQQNLETTGVNVHD